MRKMTSEKKNLKILNRNAKINGKILWDNALAIYKIFAKSCKSNLGISKQHI